MVDGTCVYLVDTWAHLVWILRGCWLIAFIHWWFGFPLHHKQRECSKALHVKQLSSSQTDYSITDTTGILITLIAAQIRKPQRFILKCGVSIGKFFLIFQKKNSFKFFKIFFQIFQNFFSNSVTKENELYTSDSNPTMVTLKSCAWIRILHSKNEPVWLQ